mmetsp:Transcript_48304/g.121662  ORF Transcript_48304/g.121662 Transcript_48304/m.121662 type:complete len:194 (-) Transcript_48304:65-646(-)
MSAFRILVIAASSAVVAAWDPDKFKPLVTACEGLETLTNCSAKFEGVCRTHHSGERFCGHAEHEHKGFWSVVHAVKHQIKKKLGGHGKHGMPKLIGDCATKTDGMPCTAERKGRCIPSGKCPVFKGEMVCKPWDAHPPEMITKPCEGKQDGDDCRLTILPGKCSKGKYSDEVVCKAWPFATYTKDTDKDPFVV